MRLVHVSDIHVHPESILGSDPAPRLQRALAHVAEYQADAERLIVTGDLTHLGEEASYRRLRALLESAALPESLEVRWQETEDSGWIAEDTRPPISS